MKIGDDEYKKKLKEYLDINKPKSFSSMVESMSWYTQARKKFIEKLQKEGALEA